MHLCGDKSYKSGCGIENYTNLTRAVGAFCVVLSVWDFENVLGFVQLD